MVTTTIAVAALIGASVLGFYAMKFKNQALDVQAKYDAIKDFADDAGKRILKHEGDNLKLATQVVNQQAALIKKDEELAELSQKLLLASSVPQSNSSVKKPRKK